MLNLCLCNNNFRWWQLIFYRLFSTPNCLFLIYLASWQAQGRGVQDQKEKRLRKRGTKCLKRRKNLLKKPRNPIQRQKRNPLKKSPSNRTVEMKNPTSTWLAPIASSMLSRFVDMRCIWLPEDISLLWGSWHRSKNRFCLRWDSPSVTLKTSWRTKARATWRRKPVFVLCASWTTSRRNRFTRKLSRTRIWRSSWCRTAKFATSLSRAPWSLKATAVPSDTSRWFTIFFSVYNY